MAEYGQNDTTLKAERPAPRAKRSGDTKAKAAFLKAVAPNAALPAHYQSAPSSHQGAAPVSDAERIRKTNARIAQDQADEARRKAEEKETDRRRREADYKPLLQQYERLQPIVGMALEATEEGAAAEAQNKLITDVGFRRGRPPQSRRIEVFLAQIKESDSSRAIADAREALSMTAFYVNQHTQASVAGTHAGTFMQNLAGAVSLSEGQIRAVVDAGVQAYHTCQADEVLLTEIQCFIDGVKVDVAIIKHLVHSCEKFSVFVRTVNVQVAAAQASAAMFGPVAPWVLACIITAEAFDAIGNLMAAIADTINLISHVTSDKKAVDDGFYTICHGFMVPLEKIENIKGKLATVQNTLKEIRGKIDKVRSWAKTLDNYRKR